MIEKFPEIVIRLAGITERFATALDYVDTGFLGDGVLDVLPTCVQLGASRVGGVDLNKPRMREAVRAAPALAPAPNGFTVAEFTASARPHRRRSHRLQRPPGGLRPTQTARQTAHRPAQPIPPPTSSRPWPHGPSPPCSPCASRSLDTRRPRIRTNSHRHANAVHRSRHRNTTTRLRIRREPVTPHHQQIVESRSSSG
jgi:hypothetical protein